MHPLFAQALGAIVRWLLSFVAGYFVSLGIWTAEDGQKYVAGAALAVVALAWSLWQKYKSHIKFLTALDSPPGTTPAQVDEKIAAGKGARIVAGLLVIGLALPLSGCARARHRATVTVVTADSVLSFLHDTEETLVCGRDTAPPAPLCVGAEQHKHNAADLLQAFQINVKVAQTVRAVPASGGSPDVAALLGQVRALIDAVLGRIPESPQRRALLVNLGGA